MTPQQLQRPLEDWATYWEKLSRRSVRLVEKLAEPGFQLHDPLVGTLNLEETENRIEKLFSQVHGLRIRVEDRAFGFTDAVAYIRWSCFLTYVAGDEPHIITGMSEIMFSRSGKVMAQTNYWDTASLPVTAQSRQGLVRGLLARVSGSRG